MDYFFAAEKTKLQCKSRGARYQTAAVHNGDILLYLGCWFFPGKIRMAERYASLLDDNYLWLAWNYPKYNTILSFLSGEQILKIGLPGLDSRLKESGDGSLAEQSLYRTSLFTYTHFEIATPKGK